MDLEQLGNCYDRYDEANEFREADRYQLTCFEHIEPCYVSSYCDFCDGHCYAGDKDSVFVIDSKGPGYGKFFHLDCLGMYYSGDDFDF